MVRTIRIKVVFLQALLLVAWLPAIASFTGAQSDCNSLCRHQTGIPVTVGGRELRRVILQYLKDPTGSPHGPTINCWDVSQVVDMSFAFGFHLYGHVQPDDLYNDLLLLAFNEPLECWDTSNVRNMYGMFYNVASFNQDIGAWDVSKVESMVAMFYNASSFNQSIGMWNTVSILLWS